jgi:undecaprenyl diphosphate synthase
VTNIDMNMDEFTTVPEHVALILDGNGRWAKAQGKPRTYGHIMGAKRVEPICRHADKRGVRFLTLYAFSTENWNRPDDEVSALMGLLGKYMDICRDMALKENMRALILGDREPLSDTLKKKAKRLEEETKSGTGLTLSICINYGSRDEMLRAMRNMYSDMRSGDEDPSAITEDRFSSYLDTAGIPDPDFLIRTSGEQRLSNYLMWQLAYAELYFTDVPWPDFDEDEFDRALLAYAGRQRRYGGI